MKELGLFDKNDEITLPIIIIFIGMKTTIIVKALRHRSKPDETLFLKNPPLKQEINSSINGVSA